jgi:hypothetical protein
VLDQQSARRKALIVSDGLISSGFAGQHADAGSLIKRQRAQFPVYFPI